VNIPNLKSADQVLHQCSTAVSLMVILWLVRATERGRGR